MSFSINRRNLIGGFLLNFSITDRGHIVDFFSRDLGLTAPNLTKYLNSELSDSGTLQLKEGYTYYISEPLQLGNGAKIIGHQTSTIIPLGDFPAIIASGENVLIDGLTIRGLEKAGFASNAFGIFLDWRLASGSANLSNIRIASVASSGIIALGNKYKRSSGLKINNCKVVNVGAHGIIAQDYIDNVVIENNFIKSSGLLYPDRPGITASRYGRNISIKNNVCVGTQMALGSSVHGISVDQSECVDCSDNIVIGWVRGYGIEAGGGVNVKIRDNTIVNCRYGIGISGDLNKFRNFNLSILNNVIKKMERCGIYSFVTNTDGKYIHQNIEIKSNLIKDILGPDIGIGAYLTDIDGLVFNDTTIDNCLRSGISLVDCSNYDLGRLRVLHSNREGLPSHAGLTLSWRVRSPAQRGSAKLDVSGIHGNGGRQQIIDFSK